MIPKTIQAVIFDFDGVIIDSEPLHYEACLNVLKETGVNLSYKEYVKKYLGLSDKEMFPQLLMDRGRQFAANEITSLINKKIEHYINIINIHPNLPFTKNITQYIEKLIQEKKKIAICSGSTKKEILAVLTKLNGGSFLPYFNTIVTSEDVEHGKPSPEGYLLTAKRLGVSPDKCLVIEDSSHGIEAATKAGMCVIAFTGNIMNEKTRTLAKTYD